MGVGAGLLARMMGVGGAVLEFPVVPDGFVAGGVVEAGLVAAVVPVELAPGVVAGADFELEVVAGVDLELEVVAGVDLELEVVDGVVFAPEVAGAADLELLFAPDELACAWTAMRDTPARAARAIVRRR